jgi:predicted RNA binding protein YcfA (HicA-like mRNA interferase family)
VSERLPPVKPKELISALERNGWRVDRIRGSHHILVYPDQHRALPVPVHNKELKAGTLASILRITGISRDELARLLRDT